MKSIVDNNPRSKIKYPMLMINTQCGRIVLFTNARVGTVVFQGNTGIDPVGLHRDDFDMNYYKPFEGSVTLSND